MINTITALEAIASAEIENGPYTKLERMAILIYMMGRNAGDAGITMEQARKVAEGIVND